MSCVQELRNENASLNASIVRIMKKSGRRDRLLRREVTKVNIEKFQAERCAEKKLKAVVGALKMEKNMVQVKEKEVMVTGQVLKATKTRLQQTEKALNGKVDEVARAGEVLATVKNALMEKNKAFDALKATSDDKLSGEARVFSWPAEASSVAANGTGSSYM